ncbi:MAG: MFS transporter, partial [Deltaproteobacteria bacterium]|nr:MFS transporter [Deltaproteobacteria bacterium]
MREPSNSPRYIIIFSILSALFTLSQFYRVSSAVIAPNLIQDLGLNAEMLGLLGGAFFYAFTLLQIPLGPMLDRIGPRMIMSLSCLIGALGAFLFAFGDTFHAVFFGRVLIGAGMAPMLMGAFKTFILRYPPEQFATLVGM